MIYCVWLIGIESMHWLRTQWKHHIFVLIGKKFDFLSANHWLFPFVRRTVLIRGDFNHCVDGLMNSLCWFANHWLNDQLETLASIQWTQLRPVQLAVDNVDLKTPHYWEGGLWDRNCWEMLHYYLNIKFVARWRTNGDRVTNQLTKGDRLVAWTGGSSHRVPNPSVVPIHICISL